MLFTIIYYNFRRHSFVSRWHVGDLTCYHSNDDVIAATAAACGNVWTNAVAASRAPKARWLQREYQVTTVIWQRPHRCRVMPLLRGLVAKARRVQSTVRGVSVGACVDALEVPTPACVICAPTPGSLDPRQSAPLTTSRSVHAFLRSSAPV